MNGVLYKLGSIVKVEHICTKDCPACGGIGEIEFGREVKPCHSCGGDGIRIANNHDAYIHIYCHKCPNWAECKGCDTEKCMQIDEAMGYHVARHRLDWETVRKLWKSGEITVREKYKNIKEQNG